MLVYEPLGHLKIAQRAAQVGRLGGHRYLKDGPVTYSAQSSPVGGGLAGTELIRYRWGDENGVIALAALYARALARTPASDDQNGSRSIEPVGLEVLAIDIGSGAQSWQPVTGLVERDYAGRLVEIQTTDHRRLTVTEHYPILVHAETLLQVRAAVALVPGDWLPLVHRPGAAEVPAPQHVTFIEQLPPELAASVRLRHPQGWGHARAALRPLLGARLDDVVTRHNSLPLPAWRALPPELQGDPETLTLVTGRGPSHSSFPAVIPVDGEMARLLGYYLSEGCISEGKGRLRLRFTFNRDEVEYLADVRALCARYGLRLSEYNSPIWHSTTLKAAGWLLPWLFRDVLCTGVDAGTMRVPDQLMAAPVAVHVELLKGLLRGDGDVHVIGGQRAYHKNGRAYRHQNNSGTVGYFSSSPELFEQVRLLMQEYGWVPAAKAHKPHLRFKVTTEHEGIETWFLGDKARRLQALQASKQRPSLPRRPQPSAGYALTRVKRVHTRLGQALVYSMEVGGAHTFAVTSGIYVQSCIPLGAESRT